MAEITNATQTVSGIVLSSTEAAGLVVLAIVACLICIWLVFSFGRRVQASAMIREGVVKAYAEQELKDLERALKDRAIDRPLDPKDPPPNFFGCHSQLWEPHIGGDAYQAKYGQPKPGETAQQGKDREAKLKACEAWSDKEKERYENLRKELPAKAKEAAEKRVPKSWDALSLLGGGYSFLLEFSTVIVIIFSILCLGFLGILGGQDIATILAATAGYVLGKASAARSESKTETSKKE